eukprot:3930196-Rhodomonas_salina.1
MAAGLGFDAPMLFKPANPLHHASESEVSCCYQSTCPLSPYPFVSPSLILCLSLSHTRTNSLRGYAALRCAEPTSSMLHRQRARMLLPYRLLRHVRCAVGRTDRGQAATDIAEAPTRCAGLLRAHTLSLSLPLCLAVS